LFTAVLTKTAPLMERPSVMPPSWAVIEAVSNSKKVKAMDKYAAAMT
jgi:hypothetical protein